MAPNKGEDDPYRPPHELIGIGVALFIGGAILYLAGKARHYIMNIGNKPVADGQKSLQTKPEHPDSKA